MNKKILMPMLFSFYLTFSCWGDVIIVDGSNGDTIQGAIAVSKAGDKIRVRPGTYYGPIFFPSHQITVSSFKGPEVTTIKASGSFESVVYFDSSQEADTILSGFTLKNGPDHGIDCIYASPTIVDNIIEYNGGTNAHGGGIFCSYGANPEIKRNVIRWNTAVNGGGIYCAFDSNPLIDGNRIQKNTATNRGGGVAFELYTDELGLMKITNNAITGNGARYGGGVYADRSGGSTMINNTIAGNEATVSGGGIAYLGDAYYQPDGDSTIINTILWNNVSPRGHEIALLWHKFATTNLIVSYSDVEGGASEVYIEEGTLVWDEGNLDPPKDPDFHDPDNGDFHLEIGSPCKDEGDNSPWTSMDEDFERNPRIWDGTVDMGADEFAPHGYFAWERAVYAGDVMLKLTGPAFDYFCVGCKKSIVLPPKVTPYGDLYLARPFKVFTRGPIPASGIYTLEFTAPASWMPGDTIYIQALIDSVLTYPAMLSIVEEPPPPEYAYDDGSPENLLGWTGGGDMCWMNRFDTIPGGENITSVKAMFGCAMYPGYGPGNGTPAMVYVWDDPNNDGDPNDCVLLGETATTVQHEDTDTFIDIALVPPVAVSGSFFVGCCLPHAPGEFVASFDTDTPYIPGSSWYCGSDVPGNFDPNNLAGLAYPPAEWTNFWCLRAGYQ